jgi:hypothetical protein
MIYLCAGMKRSGSTWLYNAVRGILKHAGVRDLQAGWITEKEKLLSHRNVVIKTHSFDANLAAQSDVVLISHRDLRDVAASLHRKFKVAFSTEGVRETFDDYTKWKKFAAYDLPYEQLLIDKISELKKIAAVLKLAAPSLEKLPYETISNEIDAENFTEKRSTTERYDATNLLHEGHITDGRHGSWENLVPHELVAAIENEFRDWMLAEGYLAPTPPAR